MKLKILSDLPGLKAGQILETTSKAAANSLIKSGVAVEAEEEVSTQKPETVAEPETEESAKQKPKK